MLNGLDAINWSKLSHAYGPADDVPGTLQALASGDISAQEAASEFWGNLCHQGTVYQATSYAVPFLIELLAGGTISDRQWLLLLLASLAVGSSYRDVHGNGLLRADARQFEQQRRQELGWAMDTHAAVGEGVPVYLALLHGIKPEVRTTAAYTLARFPERGREIAPVLEVAVLQERDADAEASLLLSLEALDGISPTLAERLLGHLSPETDWRRRLVAALILARSAGPDSTPPVVETLRAGIIHEAEVSKAHVFSVWGKEPTEELCAALWGIGVAAALPILLDLLPRVAESLAAYSVVDILMERVFSEKWGGEKTCLAGLGPTQRRILSAFVEESALWQGNVLQSLKWHYGLPADRDALKRFLAGSEVT